MPLVLAVLGVLALVVGYMVTAPKTAQATPMGEVSPVDMTFSRDSWARSLYRVCRDSYDDVPAKMIIAHAAYESGFGTAKAAKVNNLFNLTAGTSWTGPTIAGGDLEYAADGSVKNITQKFRAYASWSECIDDYWRFLGYSRYGAARMRLIAGDEVGFVTALADGIFFTLPREKYLAGFRAHHKAVLGIGLEKVS